MTPERKAGISGKTLISFVSPQRGPCNRVLARLIREQKGAWLFTSPYSKGKMVGVDISFGSACAAAELEGVTLYALRHTFGTRLVASGVDLRTVQELTGHADIKTTMIYAHIVDGNKHAAIARLNKYRENCHEITTEKVVELDVRRA